MPSPKRWRAAVTPATSFAASVSAWGSTSSPRGAAPPPTAQREAGGIIAPAAPALVWGVARSPRVQGRETGGLPPAVAGAERCRGENDHRRAAVRGQRNEADESDPNAAHQHQSAWAPIAKDPGEPSGGRPGGAGHEREGCRGAEAWGRQDGRTERDDGAEAP